MKLSQQAVAASRLEDAPSQGRPYRPRSRYTYTAGPMLFLAQQIESAMNSCGWTVKIQRHVRSPELQDKRFRSGASKARAWKSPHQWGFAVDMIHAQLGWNVEQRFWDDLAASARVVAGKFSVPLELGYDWGWDSAHIELKNWRDLAAEIGKRVPSDADNAALFARLLPDQWKAYLRRRPSAGAVTDDLPPLPPAAPLVHPGFDAMTFGAAFRAAADAKLRSFWWRGKHYAVRFK